jgi:hypothetical protein
MHLQLWPEILKVGDLGFDLRDVGLDGRIIRIIINLTETGCEGIDWVHVTLGRAQWPNVDHTIMEHRVSL